MKLHLNIIMLIFLLVPLVSAQTDADQLTISQKLGPYYQYDCIQLTVQCDNCTYANITSVAYPNGSYALQGNYAMQRMGFDYNLTYCLTSALTTESNPYIVKGQGNLNGIDAPFQYRLFVTRTGTFVSTSMSILYLAMLAIVIIFLIICFNQTFKTEKYEWSLAYGSASYLLLTSAVFFLYRFVNDFGADIPYAASILYIFLYALIIGILPGFFILILLALRSNIEDKKMKRLTDMGYSSEEARQRLRRK